MLPPHAERFRQLLFFAYVQWDSWDYLTQNQLLEIFVQNKVAYKIYWRRITNINIVSTISLHTNETFNLKKKQFQNKHSPFCSAGRHLQNQYCKLNTQHKLTQAYQHQKKYPKLVFCEDSFIKSIYTKLINSTHWPDVISSTITWSKKWTCPYTRHECIQEDWRYSPIYSHPRHKMEVSNQHHAPAFLPQEIAPSTHSIRGCLDADKGLYVLRKDKSFVSAGFEARIAQPVV
jgi:hypothetical protein